MRYGRAVSAQAAARILYLFAGAAVFVALARMLGPAQLGQYAWAVTFLAIAMALADGGMSPLIARDLVAAGERRSAWLANFLAFRLALGLLVGLLAMPVVVLLAPEAVRVPLLLCCPLLPLIAARFYDPVFQVADRPFLSVHVTLVYVALAPLGILAALLAAEPVGWAVLAFGAAAFGYGLAGLILAWRLIRPDPRAVGRGGLGEIGRAVAPLMASALITALAQRVDVLVLAELGGDAAAGQYNAAYRFLDIGSAVLVTVLTPLLSVFAALAPDRLRAAFQAMMRLIAVAGLLIGLMAIPLAEPVLRLVYGAAFAGASTALVLLAWKLAAAFVSLLAFVLVMTTASIGYTVWSSAAALAIIVALNGLLAARLGATGAAIASLGAEILQLAVNLVMAARAMPGALERGWWTRLAAAAAPAFLLALMPQAGLPLPLQAVLPASLLLALLFVLRALPRNPIPLLRIEAEARAQAAPEDGGPARDR